MNRTIFAVAGVFTGSSLLLIDSAVKGTALLMLASVAALLMRRDSAATRHLVWLLAIVAMLAVPALSALLPQWRILPQWASIPPTAAMVTTSSAAVDGPGNVEVVRNAKIDAVEPPSAFVQQPAAESPEARPVLVAPAAIPTSTDTHWNWQTALSLTWVIGFGLLILRLIAARWMLWNAERQGTVVWSSRNSRKGINDPIVTALEAAISQLRICCPVTLLMHPDKTIPVVWGILRYRLLLPATARQWSAEQLRSVLLHELAHVKRRDTLVQLLTQLACALHWFNPLVWFAAWRIGVERERACDDLVLASGVRPSAYAGHLLEVVTNLSPVRWTQSCGLAMARKSSLEGRLIAVLSENLNRRRVSTILAASALAMTIGVTVPIAMLGASLASQESADMDFGVIAMNSEDDAEQPAIPQAKPKTITIHGKVVDDETGKPVERLIVEGGNFDPAKPAKVTWGGYSRISDRDGSFSWTIQWAEGRTARIVADGYLPQPVLSSAPPDDKEEIVVTIRLKRGRSVKGQVLNHTGKPVVGASVFAVGPITLNLGGGKAWQQHGPVVFVDDFARPALTDDEGRFQLPAGEAKSVAVSYSGLEAWPAAIPPEGEVTIRLPQPARIDVELNIDGAAECKLFYHWLKNDMPERGRLLCMRELPIANGGKLSLTSLPPGKYQFCRDVIHRFGTAMLDQELFEIKAGETKTIRWVRDKGARVRGKLSWPKDVKLSHIIVSVKSENAVKDPFDGSDWHITYASQIAAADGGFLTERVSPGRYLLAAEAFPAPTPGQRWYTGTVDPSFRTETRIDVPDSGELRVRDLPLHPIKPGNPNVAKASGASAEGDLKKLQGQWTVKTIVHDGKVALTKNKMGSTWTIKDKKITYGETYPGHDIFQLDADKSPRTLKIESVRMTGNDKKVSTFKGIYKLDGNTLTICFDVSDKVYPPSFESKPGSGFRLITLTRVE